MRVLVVYDSVYGNTEKIAKAISTGLQGEVEVAKVTELDLARLSDIGALIVGSPTLGGRPTQAMQDFLSKIPDVSVKGVRVASFDTRYSGRFVKVFGFAADKIAESLTSKGAVLGLPPEPFYVTGKKGPLKEGEVDRAVRWANSLTK